MLKMQAFTDYSSESTPTSLVIDRYRGDADVSGGRVGEVAIVEGEKWRRNHVTSLQPIKKHSHFKSFITMALICVFFSE